MTVDLTDADRELLHNLSGELRATATDAMRAMIRYHAAHPETSVELDGLLKAMWAEKQAAKVTPAKRSRKRA